MKTKLLLMLLAIALVAGAAQANMLVNSSFEDGAFGVNYSPDNWEHYYTSYPDPVHTWVSNAGEAHSGNKYVKMYNWLVSYTTWNTTAWLGQEVSVKEGKDYSFSVWTRNDGKGQTNLAGVWCDWLDSVDNVIGADSVALPVVDANWIEIDFGSMTAPKGAVAVDFWLFASIANDLKAICYDDVIMLGADPNITAGADMISWDGETVSLTGTVDFDDYSTITWSAEPDYGAAITNGNTLTPTVDVDCIIPSGPATIANHSFENGLDNWEITSGAGHGTWGGYDVVEPNGLTVFITPADGLECAYVDGVTDGMGHISQVLANNLVAANTTYTLSVDLVNDGYYEKDVAYRVQLRAGGGLLAQDNDSHALDTYGEWKTSTVTYDSGASPTYLGEPLEIRLLAKAGTNRMNFDNVRLTADPNFGAYVPDVVTYKLKLDIDGKYDTMKIDVYPDACSAKLAAGLREPTDLVDDTCITNLADLAEMVKTWTDHNALTEPKLLEVEEKSLIYFDGFEVPDFGDSGWEYNPAGSVWTFIAGSGLSGSNGPWACDSVSPDPLGDQFAFLQGAAKISQEMTVLGIGGVYKVSFYESYRTAMDGAGNDLSVILDEGLGTEVTIYTNGNVNNNTWEARTTSEFVVSRPSHKLTFRSTNPRGGDRSTLIDGVGLEVISAGRTPEYDSYVGLDSELELSWTNIAPSVPGDPVYVDVWFGTDPNDYNDFNKILDATTPAGEDANSVTADASVEGTYYWQVNSYIYGDPDVVVYDDNDLNPDTFPIIEGAMWSFIAVTDIPVSVDASGDWITWSGQAIQLDASVDDDGVSGLTIVWSADDPNVVFDPNEFVEDPTVTITKVPGVTELVIINAGFEDPPYADGDWAYGLPAPWRDGYYWGTDDWVDDPYSAGIENPAYAYGGIVPEGENAAFQESYYSGDYGGYNMGLRQILAAALEPDVHYELSVMVGNPGEIAPNDYLVELLAGGDVLNKSTGASPDPNTWTASPVTVTYDSPSTVAAGRALEIRLVLMNNDTTGQVLNFDDVKLAATGSAYPKVVTLTLSVSDDVSSAEDSMTIEVYDTPCIAAIAPGDFDADCDTDLEDYAALAEEWLVYNELTTSIVKP